MTAVDNVDPAANNWQGKQAPEVDVPEGPDEIAGGRQASGRKLLGELIRPRRRAILGVLVLALLQTASSLTPAWLVGVAIDDTLPQVRHGHYLALVSIGSALVIAALLAAWLRAVFVLRSGVIGQQLIFDLRCRTFDHVQQLSVSFHERFTSGRVISRLTSDIDTLTELLDTSIDGLLIELFGSIAIAALLVVLDWELALIAFLALVPLWLLYRWFSPRAEVAYRATREKVAAMIVNIVETFNGVRAVQAFRREKRNDAIFADLNRQYRDANRVTFNLQALFIPGTTLIGNTAIVAILLVGGFRVTDGGLQLGVLTSFLLYLRQFYDPMEDLGMFYNSLQSATAALTKISAVLAEEPSVAEPYSPTALSTPARGAVSLEGVEFSYRDDHVVLAELDLDIPAGQTVALVGATGAGKTTIAKLISRFYDPTHGVVSLDGVDLRDVADEELHDAVVMITQDGFLFSGSVADNIGFGRLGSTRDEITTAAKAVGAHEFIASLPDGYDTDVRKRGGRLSAGQRQLVAFARAFLADPSVLILDEATSSLDVPTERAVQRALHTVLAQRTALIIAHRLSTVEIADRVLVLENGHLIEDGSPDSLVASGQGHFASLHESWRDSLA